MNYEPSDKMVEAAARVMFPRSDLFDEHKWEKARAALKAAFAAAIENGEAQYVAKNPIYEGLSHPQTFTVWHFPAIILRTQEGGK